MAVYLGLSLVVYAFLQPHQHYLYNCMETLLTAGALLLIITWNTQSVDQVPTRDNRNNESFFTKCESNYAKVYWGMLIFYYLPAVTFLLSFMVAVIVAMKR